jgi:hypothetical protein
LLALALGCGRPGSSGSSLEGPDSWQAGAEGHALIVPADALSVTLLARGPTGELLALGVRDDAGRVLVDPADPEGSPNRFLRGHGLSVGAIPAGTATLPLAGRYVISAPAGATVSVWTKRGGPGVPAVQELPLTLVLVGRAGSLGSQLDLALGELGRIWRGAGVEILEPVRVRVEGPAQVAVDPALGSDSPAVAAALSLAPAGALALVVVEDLNVGGEGLFALSGAIPVPPVPTPHSGVLASAALIAHDPLWAGQVIAHEVGHALGLFHTTERPSAGAAIHDLLDDTPACPAAADLDRDGALDARECDGADGGNLMFWATARGATQLTAGQAAMARRSALVH